MLLVSFIRDWLMYLGNINDFKDEGSLCVFLLFVVCGIQQGFISAELLVRQKHSVPADLIYSRT